MADDSQCPGLDTTPCKIRTVDIYDDRGSSVRLRCRYPVLLKIISDSRRAFTYHINTVRKSAPPCILITFSTVTSFIHQRGMLRPIHQKGKSYCWTSSRPHQSCLLGLTLSSLPISKGTVDYYITEMSWKEERRKPSVSISNNHPRTQWQTVTPNISIGNCRP